MMLAPFMDNRLAGECLLVHVDIIAERSEANKCAVWHLALRMFISIILLYICSSVTLTLWKRVHSKATHNFLRERMHGCNGRHGRVCCVPCCLSRSS